MTFRRQAARRRRSSELRRARRRARDRAVVRVARSLPNKPLLLSALSGMAIAGYLTAVRWLDATPAGCGAGSECDLVQASRFASLLGVPIAAWGAALYGTLAAVALFVRDDTLHSRLSLGLSGVGTTVSLYLTAVSVFGLGAVCGWCLASLGAATVCFGVALVQAWRGPPRRTLGLELGALAVGSVLLVSTLHLYHSGWFVPAETAETSRLRALAFHLQATGARFYGASWCETCVHQKRLFRGASRLLPYVECSPEGRRGPKAPLCRAEEIERYPTWIIAGRRHEGLLAVDVLAALSGFDESEPAPERKSASERRDAD